MVTQETSRVQRRKFRVGESPEIPRQWSGRVNHQTFLKQVALFGNDQFIVSGGDCGNLFIWDRFGEQDIILKKPADPYVLNCVAVHPHLPVVATSGIASVADIWEPLAKFKSRITERRILAADESTTISTPESFVSQIETAKNLYALGNNLYQLNMFKEALSKFEEMADVLLGLRSVVPERNSLLEMAWNNCAAAMIQLRKYVDAVRVCDCVLDINPSNIQAWSRRNECVLRLRNFR
jgi:tetratricopeptide (TPR) repeat protein